jgi:hypothetical protein
MPLVERVLTARRLVADGLTRAEIAEHLGVSVVSVWRYVNASACTTCGGPVVTQGDLCRACALARRSGSPWTRDQVLEAITAWVAETGTTPGFRDWMPSRDRGQPNRWERDWPRWPHASAVATHFGDWTSGLRAAGFSRRFHGRWTDEEILHAVSAWTADNGRPPRTADWSRGTHEHPAASTAKTRFGGWRVALAAAATRRSSLIPRDTKRSAAL